MVYTDGSKLSDGSTGSEVYILDSNNKPLASQYVSLSIDTEVFQAEVVAIKTAVDLIVTYWNNYPPIVFISGYFAR